MAFNDSMKRQCSKSMKQRATQRVLGRENTRAYVLNVFALAAVVLGYSIQTPVAAAEDWRVVRGDVSGTGVAPNKLPDQLTELWTYKAADPAGFDATAVIADGIIYVGDNEGTIHAVRLSDGKALWTKEFEESSGFAAGAAIHQGRLFVADMSGTARCLDLTDGRELWTAKLESEVHAGPTPVENSVLFTTEGGTLACLDSASGDKKWEFKIDAPLRCTPTIKDGRAMLAGCDSLLHAINVSDGSEAFTVDIDGPTGATAAMLGDRVFFGTEGGIFYGVDVGTADGKTPSVAWTYRDPRRGQPIRSAAAVTEKLVVFGSQGRAVTAIDPKTGEEKWKLATRSRVDSSPVIAGDRVVAATSAGKLYLLDTADGAAKWEADFGGGFLASPAVVDGRLIIGNTDGTLYCFGAKPENGRNLTTENTEGTEKKK